MGCPGINQSVDPLEFTDGRIADLNPFIKCSHSLMYFSISHLAIGPSAISMTTISLEAAYC